jgi:hypothetical protein
MCLFGANGCTCVILGENGVFRTFILYYNVEYYASIRCEYRWPHAVLFLFVRAFRCTLVDSFVVILFAILCWCAFAILCWCAFAHWSFVNVVLSCFFFLFIKV